MTHADVEFGSLNEHWHPGETPEYVTEAVQRVRKALNLSHTRDLTLSTIATLSDVSTPLPVVSELTLRAMQDQPGRFACAIFREASDAATDRPALYTTCWSSAHTPEAKQRRALEMREAGYTLTEIARELGYAGKSGAQYAIRQARAQREGVRDVA